jgi:hypothetical protein
MPAPTTVNYMISIRDPVYVLVNVPASTTVNCMSTMVVAASMGARNVIVVFELEGR